MQPLDEPAGFVRIVVALEVRGEFWERLLGKAIAGDRNERARWIVRFLLELCDFVVVVQFDEAVLACAVEGFEIVRGDRRAVVRLERVEEVADIEGDEIVAGDDERVFGEVLALD